VTLFAACCALACCALYLQIRSILLCHYYPLTPMSHSADEGEPSEQDKQEVFQDLLAGSEYVLLTPFQSLYVLLSI
jgi:hypothetical protein